MKFLRKFFDGIIAGLIIAIGGMVFLSCYAAAYEVGMIVGALFFSVALLCICIKGYSLYTGKIGYILDRHSKDDISTLLLGLLGNIVATIACGYLLASVFPAAKEMAETLVELKRSQELWQALIRAIFCGMLVYLAVDIYREKKSTIGIIFCIPTFILCGFEHSIADIFYFSMSGFREWKDLLYLLVIILGNSIGSLIIPLLKFKKSEPKA